MTNTTITIGDFEIIQLVLRALDFKCVSNNSSVYKKVYRKDDIDILVNKCNSND